MKLLNHSIKYLSISILIVIGIWGVVFFFNMVEEIKENADEGLENYKNQIIQKIQKADTIIPRLSLEEGFYTIKEIEKEKAIVFKEVYADTLMMMQDSEDGSMELDPVRILTTVFKNNDHYYELKIINPMVEKDDLIQRLLLNMIWLYAVLIITIVIVNNLVLQRLWKPFYTLLRKIKSYRLGSNLSIPEVKTKTKEFIDLQNAVGTLLRHNIEVFEQQKEFIGNASHELQTPLAIAINKLELLLENEQLQPDQADQVAEVLVIIERLTRMNKSLLLLSKIENKQFPNEQTVLVNTIIKNAMEDMSETALHKNIQFMLQEESEMHLEGNQDLIEILIYNLIRNALFHNKRGGSINIVINQAFLTISNTGEESPLHADRIFKRFYKSGMKTESSGLGLAIVSAIAETYNIRIEYSFTERQHTFKVIP
ncbi:MAG TPA: HAMP domain-containing sensor histidine kinase [Flavobacteriaceae bacterium]|nr:HAMP domain-containing sensor histidine kinase [Flavobacteriaceae bacterium]